MGKYHCLLDPFGTTWGLYRFVLYVLGTIMGSIALLWMLWVVHRVLLLLLATENSRQEATAGYGMENSLFLDSVSSASDTFVFLWLLRVLDGGLYTSSGCFGYCRGIYCPLLATAGTAQETIPGDWKGCYLPLLAALIIMWEAVAPLFRFCRYDSRSYHHLLDTFEYYMVLYCLLQDALGPA